MGRAELRRPMEPLRSQSFRPVQASVYTSLLHFDFHITKRNWSRIQLFNNNVKHNLTPICYQGCERDIFIFDIQHDLINDTDVLKYLISFFFRLFVFLCCFIFANGCNKKLRMIPFSQQLSLKFQNNVVVYNV